MRPIHKAAGQGHAEAVAFTVGRMLKGYATRSGALSRNARNKKTRKL